MKRKISSYSNKFNIVLFLSLIFAVSIVISSEASAQRRGGGHMVRMGGRGFGGFYSPSRSYVHFAPRIGARINVLPFGYMSFWFGGIPYYYYDGVYYQYYPREKEYVVVEKPAGAENVPNLKFDQVRMNDGSTLEGVFMGATDSTVTIRVGDKNHDISIGNITSISFAPAIKDTTQKK